MACCKMETTFTIDAYLLIIMSTKLFRKYLKLLKNILQYFQDL